MASEMGNTGKTFKNKNRKQKKVPQDPSKNGKGLFVWILIIEGLFYLFQWVFSSLEETSQEITYKEFYHMVEANRETGSIALAVKIKERVAGKFSDGRQFAVNIPE